MRHALCSMRSDLAQRSGFPMMNETRLLCGNLEMFHQLGIGADRQGRITCCLAQNFTRLLVLAVEVKFMINVRKFDNEFKMQASVH